MALARLQCRRGQFDDAVAGLHALEPEPTDVSGDDPHGRGSVAPPACPGFPSILGVSVHLVRHQYLAAVRCGLEPGSAVHDGAEDVGTSRRPVGHHTRGYSLEDAATRADAAERRLAGRIAREDAEDSSSAGLIKEIYCENFMCHKKLEIKLGRRINFINGANGSGKSAILAAMQICLGASAKQTHRGNKLGDLVREGSDATAEVVVKLVNEGTDAFRHETYGDTIGIRRRFGRKGGGKLDMLNENDEKVTSDRKELRSLLDSLKISVDNPVCVLDQENSKHFIRGKAKDKYKFFLRATEIEDVMNRITRCTSAADKCISDAEHQRGKLESFARLAQNAQREYEEVMRLAKYDEEIRDLKARRRVHGVSRVVFSSMLGRFGPRRGTARPRRRDGVVTRPRPRRFY